MEPEEYPSDNYKSIGKQDKFYCLAHKAIEDIEDEIVFCLEDDSFYLYNSGYWSKVYDVALLSSLGKRVPEIYKYNSTMRKQILENLKLIKHTNLNTFNIFGMLNLSNGMLLPAENKIVEHSPHYFSTNQIGYNFDIDAECPLWEKTIDEILEGSSEKIESLQEFFGYCLTRDVRYEKGLLLLGDSRCLGGETLIYDPIKDISLPVSQIKEDFHVEAWDGNKKVIAKALKPFTKDVDALYEVTLSNGESFVCSKSHLILTSYGYKPLGELDCGYEVFLPQTNWDNDLLAHKQDARHCLKTTQDLRYGYHSLSRSYDEQPHSDLNIFQSFFPSQDDALQHISFEASLHKDDLVNKQVYNHQHQLIPHPSTLGDSYLLEFQDCRLNYVFCKVYESIYYLRLAICQSLSEIFHRLSTLISYPLDNYCDSMMPYNPPLLVITSIVYKRHDVKYDFTVPIYHNYICGGAVHHNSGKSTVLQTLKNMLGEKNFSAVPLKNLTNPQYTDMMVGKLANIDSDVSSKAEEFEEEFKKIVTGEEISSNQKYVPVFSFKPYCKIVLAANDFPRIKDHSSAFYKRLILIPCDRVFLPHEQNIDLKNQLAKELSGILNWAIKGLIRLNNRKHFITHEYMSDAIAELREESNPVDLFFNEHVVSDIKAPIEVDKGELFSKYKAWCATNNHYFLSSAKFSQCVFRKYSTITPKNTKNNVTGKRVWKNIMYVESKNINNAQQTVGWTE